MWCLSVVFFLYVVSYCGTFHLHCVCYVVSFSEAFPLHGVCYGGVFQLNFPSTWCLLWWYILVVLFLYVVFSMWCLPVVHSLYMVFVMTAPFIGTFPLCCVCYVVSSGGTSTLHGVCYGSVFQWYFPSMWCLIVVLYSYVVSSNCTFPLHVVCYGGVFLR